MASTSLHIPGSTVLVVDYGGQYTHLIARRIRELGVLALIEPYTRLSEIDLSKYSAIILSGSHRSVLSGDILVEESAKRVLYETSVPVLGICFGHQLVARILGGTVKSGCSEYGRVLVRVIEHDYIFRNWSSEEYEWMSHSDCVSRLPLGSKILAVSENGYIAALKVVINSRPVYTVQFHPEVIHTPRGQVLLDNFVEIAGLERRWKREYYYNYILEEAEKYKSIEGRVLAAISGGVDSTVAALVVKRVLGSRLIPVFVDHGLFREGESEEVVEMLKRIGLEPLVMRAQERFLSKLDGVKDCETRRRVIGEEFAHVFSEIMESEGARAIVQGTTYPDIVESGATGVADKIKTRHNVAGLPVWFREKYFIIEPLKYLYKDEVREIAKLLGSPKYFIQRHLFPGPGLAVRIIGEFSRRKLEICRKATAIVESVLKKHGVYSKVWQAFAVVGDDLWVGVKGDSRKLSYVVTVRIVESSDAMTADYAKIPYTILDEISSEIARSINEVTMVTYAVTTKPPSTIEPC